MTAEQSKRSKPTIETVAHRAGVSRQTVSNVIRNPDRVRAETRDRVRRAIDELRYRPNRLARALQARATRTLAYRCHEAGENENLLLDRFLHDLCRAAARRDYHIVLISPVDLAGELSDYDTLFHSGAVDGFVLSGTAPGDPRLHQLTSERIPFVSFGRNWDDPGASTWVDVDGAAGTAEATRYFWAAGHRRIAWLGGVNAVGAALDRQLGYRRAIAAAGGEPLLFECLDTIEAAEATARRVLDHDDAADRVRVRLRPARPGLRRRRRGAWAEARHRARRHRLRRQPVGHRPPSRRCRRSANRRPRWPTPSSTRSCAPTSTATTSPSVLLAPTLVHRGST